jgi:tRNA 2-thiouridine synthesizing protein A
MTRDFQRPRAAAPPVRIDALGLKCPLPALKTRRALAALAPGATMEIVADDPLSAVDVPHAATQGGGEVIHIDAKASVTTFLIRKVSSEAKAEGSQP